MASPRSSKANSGFLPLLMVSIIVHVGSIGTTVYAVSLSPPRIQPSASIPVELVRLGKPRDPELLPRKVRAPPPPPPAPPPPPEPPPPEPAAPEPPPPAEAVAVPVEPPKTEKEKPKPKTKAKPKKSPRLSKAAQRLLQNRSSSEARLDDALAKLDEQEGSPDGSLRGTTTDPSKAAEGYIRALTEALDQAYDIPAAIPAAQRPFLKARVVLFIDRNGRITKFEFIERHSNKLFMSALENLLRTIRLPRPPAALRRRMARSGVEINFSP